MTINKSTEKDFEEIRRTYAEAQIFLGVVVFTDPDTSEG